MEELLPGTPEEPLRGRVVRGAALRARRPGQLVLPADADPSGPPVTAATVGVDDRTLPVPERGARVAEHPVGQLGVRARADHPGHRHPVTAVDHRAEVDLARGDAELRQVGRPQPVRPLGVEVPVDEVVRSLAADLALVRAVAAGPLEQGDEPVPLIQPHGTFTLLPRVFRHNDSSHSRSPTFRHHPRRPLPLHARQAQFHRATPRPPTVWAAWGRHPHTWDRRAATVPGHCLIGYPRCSTTCFVDIGVEKYNSTARSRSSRLNTATIPPLGPQENVRSPQPRTRLVGSFPGWPESAHVHMRQNPLCRRPMVYVPLPRHVPTRRHDAINR